MMICILLLIILLYLGVNGWLFYDLLRLIPAGMPAARVCAAIIFWSLVLALPLFQALHRWVPLPLGHVIYWTSTGWLAFMLYYLMSSGLCALLCRMGLALPHPKLLCIGLTSVVLAIGYYRFSHPSVRHLRIACVKPLTTGEPLRIVAVSDVHLGYGITRERLRGYVDAINAQRPDVVVIGGDLVDMSVRPLVETAMHKELLRIEAPQGVYMVPGNHEYRSGIRAAIRFAQTAGIRLLRDECTTLPCGITLVGRDDRSNSHRLPLGALLQRVPQTGSPVFVLDHQPANAEVEQMVAQGVDFAFFGHTHRGQLWPLSWLTDCLYTVSHGYCRRGRTQLYVSTGLGLWGPPFRIGSDCEMVVLDFGPAS